MAQPLKIYMFGQFYISLGQEKLNWLKARKARELFWFLLLHPEKAHHREALADLLWGGSTQGKKYLRKAIWQLRKYLKQIVPKDAESVLLINQDWLQINPQANLTIDTQVLESTSQALKGINGIDLSPQAFSSLCSILELYMGELLEGTYAAWCLVERERYREIYLALIAKLIEYCLSHGQFETGIHYSQLLLRQDQINERCHRALMRLYHLSNNRIAAICQYQDCKALLEKELGVAPSQRTQQLYLQILADQQITNHQAPMNSTSRRTDPLPRLAKLEIALHRRLPQEHPEI